MSGGPEEPEEEGDAASAAPVVYAIRLSARVTRDAEAALVFLAGTAGEGIAAEWYRGLRDAIGSLATLPGRCPIAEEAAWMRPPLVRVLRYERTRGGSAWRVLYRVRERGAGEGPRVEVLALHHAAAKPLTRKEARRIDAEGAHG